MRRILAHALAFGGVGFVVAACGSIPDVTFSDDDAATPSTDGGDGSVTVDGCTKSGPENCTDGIDNDCNGKVDCEDPACLTGFVCTDAPAGWSPIAFAAASKPACSASTTSTDLKVTGGDGAASGTCACSCTVTGPSCATGNYTVSFSNEGTCSVGATTANVPTSGNCVALATNINVPAATNAKIAPPSGPTGCNATGAGFGLTDGRACDLPAYGKGCAVPGTVCAPRVPTGFLGCVSKGAKDACPSGYTKRNTAGTAGTEGRTCTGCACTGPTACVAGKVSLYDNDMCKTNGGNKGAVDIVTTCGPAAPDSGFSAKRFESTPPSGGACTPTAASGTPSGEATFTNLRTVCCR